MSGIRVEVSGSREVAKWIGSLGHAGELAAKKALLRAGNKIVPMAKALAPVQVPNHLDPVVENAGKLRDSIHLEDAGPTAVDVVADVDYAETVHEDLTLQHDVGEAKFIERPVFQVAPDIPGEIEAELMALAGKG